ncbi:MAG TPA: HTH domain-containing protein [Actinomycetota bacterium]
MDELEAAVRVLEEEGEPLHWTVIQDLALKRGYLDPFTRKDIRRRLIAALAAAAKRPDHPIRKTGKGVYTLQER